MKLMGSEEKASVVGTITTEQAVQGGAGHNEAHAWATTRSKRPARLMAGAFCPNSNYGSFRS